jgi:hypothetical protein
MKWRTLLRSNRVIRKLESDIPNLSESFTNKRILMGNPNRVIAQNREMKSPLGEEPSRYQIASSYLRQPNSNSRGKIPFVTGKTGIDDEFTNKGKQSYVASQDISKPQETKIGHSIEEKNDDNHTADTLNYQPSSGVRLERTPDKTTTILGNYNKDMSHIIRELGNVKSTDFGPRVSNFNVLNVPDEFYKNPKQFWNEFNQPWLESVISRKDKILMATKPEFGSENLLFRRNYKTGKYELSGFGKEYHYLRKNGYILNSETMQMVPK